MIQWSVCGLLSNYFDHLFVHSCQVIYQFKSMHVNFTDHVAYVHARTVALMAVFQVNLGLVICCLCLDLGLAICCLDPEGSLVKIFVLPDVLADAI